ITAGDVDGSGRVDIIAGDILASANNRADIILFRNGGNDSNGQPIWTTQTLVSAENMLDPESPPYYPPASYLHAYGLALGDMDGDGHLDLLVTDRASYVYLYRNNGSGGFSPIRY